MTTPTQPPAPPERPTPATDLAEFEGLVNAFADTERSAVIHGGNDRAERAAAARADLLKAHHEALVEAERATDRSDAAESLADRLAGALRECRSMLDALPRSHGSHRFDLIKDCVACQVAETMRTTGEALRAYDEAKKGGTTP